MKNLFKLGIALIIMTVFSVGWDNSVSADTNSATRVAGPWRIWKTESRSFRSPPATIFLNYRYSQTGVNYRGYLGLRNYDYAPGNRYTYEGWLYRSDQPYPIPYMIFEDNLNLLGGNSND